jgi:hypothetical protein
MTTKLFTTEDTEDQTGLTTANSFALRALRGGEVNSATCSKCQSLGLSKIVASPSPRTNPRPGLSSR